MATLQITACVLLSTIAASGQPAANWTFTTIDYPGASATTPRAINNTGTIVGSYIDAKQLEHGFTLKNGVFTTIDYPGAVTTRAYGINDSGQIVGCYYTYSVPGACYYGFLFSKGIFSPITVMSQQFTEAYGINKSDQITVFGIIRVQISCLTTLQALRTLDMAWL